MNLLVVDIGNSSIKSGLFRNDKLTNFKIFENVNLLLKYFSNKNVRNIAVSSVVPKNKNLFIKLSKEKFHISPFIISKRSNFNLKINYKIIETLGIDRICSAEGAFQIFKKSNEFKKYNKNTFIISIDCGTATTINIIKFPGEFIGGLIAPGLKMMFDSLNKKTSQLPKVTPNEYKNLIGNSTKSSIASGVINSNIGMLEKTINDLKENHQAKKIILFLTGRNAKYLIPHLRFNCTFEKGLVLYGIKSVFEKNKY